MSGKSSNLAKELADQVISAAGENGLFISDHERIRELALKDPVTVKARGTGDALNRYGSPSFISRLTSRSAAMTEM